MNRRDYTSSEIEACWWSEQDLQQMKLDVRAALVRVVHDKSKAVQSLVHIVDDAYNLVLDLSLRVDDDEEDRILHNPGAYTFQLEDWVRSPAVADCRGVERYVSRIRQVANDAKLWRRNIVHMYELGYDEDEIAQVYQEAGCAARLFARMMGHVDSKAASSPPKRSSFSAQNEGLAALQKAFPQLRIQL